MPPGSFETAESREPDKTMVLVFPCSAFRSLLLTTGRLRFSCRLKCGVMDYQNSTGNQFRYVERVSLLVSSHRRRTVEATSNDGRSTTGCLKTQQQPWAGHDGTGRVLQDEIFARAVFNITVLVLIVCR